MPRKRKISRKDKKFLRKRTLIIVFFIYIVSVVLIYRWFEYSELKHSELIESTDSFPSGVFSCDSLSGNQKSACEIYKTECESASKTNESAIFCLAAKLSELSLDVSEKVCGLLEDEAIQKHCFAKVLSQSDLEVAKEQCNLIDDIIRKAECNADILKEIDMEAALKECDAVMDFNQRNWCKSHIIAFEDKEKGRKYCDLITHQALRQLCYAEIEKAGR